MIARAVPRSAVMLAVSLHAVRDELRNELVPLNRKISHQGLLEACRTIRPLECAAHHVRICDAQGVNDAIADAKALVRLLEASRPRST